MAKLVYAFLLALLIPAQTVWAKSIQDAIVETPGTEFMYTIDKGNIPTHRENGSTLLDDPVIIGDRATPYKGSTSRINVENSVEAGLNEGSNKGPITFPGTKATTDIGNCILEIQSPVYYTGQEQEPSFTLKDGNIKLEKDKDYEVLDYENNIHASKEEARIHIMGKGKYSGEGIFPFEIKPAPLTLTGVTVKDKYEEDNNLAGEIADKGTLNGVYNSDNVDVDWSAAQILFSSTANIGDDIPVTLSGLTLTGAAKDNYELQQPIELEGRVRTRIKLDKDNFKWDSTDDIYYTGQAQEPSFTLTDGNGKKLIKNIDYEVFWDENVNASDLILVNIIGKGIYKGNFSIKFEIKPKELTLENVTVKDKDQGDEQVGEIVNRGELSGICEGDEGKVEVDWSAAKIEFESTANVGNNIKVTLSGLTLTGAAKDNYKLSQPIQLEGKVFDPKDITGFKVKLKAYPTYNREPQEPSFTLKDRKGNDVELVEGTDYKVSYDKNVQASTNAKIIITGQGEYRGLIEEYFLIQTRTIFLENIKIKDKYQHDDRVGEIADKGTLISVVVGDEVYIDWSKVEIWFSSTDDIGNNIPVYISNLLSALAGKDHTNYKMDGDQKEVRANIIARPEPTPPPPPPAEETWYILTIEGFDGLVTSPAAGSYSVVEGSSFTVHFNLPEGYVESDLRVMLDESEIDFRHVNGNLYAVTIGNVISDACLSIDKQAVFTIEIPDVRGVVTDPSAGIYPVGRFDSFPFSLTLEDDYDQSEVSVRVNGEELPPLALRSAAYDYRIDSISKDLHIEILNVCRNDAVANETIDSDRPHIYTYQGTLCVELFREAPVTIHAISGLPVVARRLSPGVHRFSLPAGVYIVTVDKERWKVRMSGSK